MNNINLNKKAYFISEKLNDSAETLSKKGYAWLPNAYKESDDIKYRRLIINYEQKSFWITSKESLENIKSLFKNKHNEEVTEISSDLIHNF